MILWTFWTKEKYPKICKPRFPLSIKHLLSGLKTHVFETEVGVGGFQMLIFGLFVKIFPKNKRPLPTYLKKDCACRIEAGFLTGRPTLPFHQFPLFDVPLCLSIPMNVPIIEKNLRFHFVLWPFCAIFVLPKRLQTYNLERT
jgi:hypothetical protein